MDTTTSKSCDVDLFFCSPPIPLALCVCSDDRLLKLTEPVYFNHYLIQQEYCLLFHRLYSGGLHQGIKNNFNYIHTQIMIFIIDLTIKAEEKTLRL